jgi:hypothetical protein
MILRLRLLLLLVPTLALLASPVMAAGMQRDFDVRPGGDLVIEAEGATIEIETGGDGASVQILRRGDSEDEILDDYEVDFRQDGNRLVIEIDRKHDWKLWNSGRGLEVKVRVPQTFNVDVSTSGGSVSIADLDGEVAVDTSGGSIRLAGSRGSADVKTSGGSIALGQVEGEVKARTSGGSIEIDRAHASVDAHTSGGSIKVHEVKGPIDASTSGGSVQAYISEPPTADSRLQTSGGTVTVYLDDSIGVDLDAHSSGGRVRSDFDVLTRETSRNSLSGPLNGGGPSLVLRTSGGSVRVLRK